MPCLPIHPPCLQFDDDGADSVEKHEPVSDIDTVVPNSLKVLDPEWPIREADIVDAFWHVRFVPIAT